MQAIEVGHSRRRQLVASIEALTNETAEAG
jgi:hypothetical protein